MREVKILLANVEEYLKNEAILMERMAPSYRAKAAENKISEESRQELVAGYLLWQYLGVSRDEQLRIGENGKPYLADKSVFFNLSHSGNYVALAIAGCEVGVDLERVMNYHEATVLKVFTEAQQERLACAAPEEKNELFSQIFTELEATLKLTGIGFEEAWRMARYDQPFLKSFALDGYILTCATNEPVLISLKTASPDFLL